MKAEVNWQLGRSGDGYVDLAIGVPLEAVGTVSDDPGAVNVIYGSATGLSATSIPDQFWHQDVAEGRGGGRGR